MTESGFIGIDLGTTMSAIAHLDSRGVATVLPNSDGEPLTPSAIYLDGGHAVVGKSAKQSISHLPDKVATFVKREMGKSAFSRRIDGRQFRPETLSAIILRKLKQDAERKVGPITRAVITVPAFFDDLRRKATEDAGRIAGFDSVAIINEPTAAALAYCLEGHIGKAKSAVTEFPGGNLTALVYDLGGGTFDVTVIRMQAKRVHILATDGAVKLGGKDWDDRIVNHVVAAFQNQFGVTIPLDRRHGLLNLAETTKKLLSQIPVAEIEHSYQDHTVRLTLQRTEFDSLTRDLLAQTEVVTKLVLKQAGLPGCEAEPNWNAVDRILLVGGSTKMPMVPAMLKRLTGKQPDNSLDPDQVVAKGACIYGAVMATQEDQAGVLLSADVQDDVKNVGITDVNSHSLGIMTLDASEKPTYKILIKKNQPVPCAGSMVCRTPTATSLVKVPVLEGEAPDPDANIRLGECVVHVPGGLPARSPFHVRLNFAKNGRVGVIALDMTSGRYVEVQIERQSGLNEEQILQEREFVTNLNIV